MKYEPSYDGVERADFKIVVRLTKKTVERIRYYLKKTTGRGLDIDVRGYIENVGAVAAREDIEDYFCRLASEEKGEKYD